MSVKSRLILVVAIPAILAGCAQQGSLEPLEGNSLPVTPVDSESQPTAEDLLDVGPQAAPERSVELRRRSEEREDDPFDLPPQG